MIKEFRKKQDGDFIQITTDDERFYQDTKTGKFYPSCTWVLSYYPKGIQFYKWLAQTGWDESRAIRDKRGKEGSSVHNAVESLLHGAELMHDVYSVKEWKSICSFVDYWDTTDFKPLLIEHTFIDKELGVAGTVDLVCANPKMPGVIWVIDLKTSQSVWKEYEIQISVYGEMVRKLYPNHEIKLAILQLGYSKNRKGYKFTEYESKIHLFPSIYNLWEEENGSAKPKQMNLPSKLSLNIINQ